MFYRNKVRTNRHHPRTWIVFTGCLLLLATFGNNLALASDETIDYTEFALEDLMEMSVVYGASKYLQKSKEAPASISIVEAEEIRTFGYRNLAEVLVSLAGFQLTYDRSYKYLGVRGLGQPGDLNTRILVLVDGVRVNEASLGGVLTSSGFPVDVDLIDRIEVIRGPASSLYGTNALLGIINIVTREGYKIDGFEAKAGVGSFGGLEGRLTGGYETTSGVDLLFSGTIGKNDGQDHYISEFNVGFPPYNDGVFRDGDAEEWSSLFGKVLYEGFTLETMYSWRKKHNPMAPWPTLFNDNSARDQDSQLAISARYQTKIPGGIDLVSQLYYQYFKWDAEYPYDFDYEGNPIDYVDPLVDLFRGKRLTAEMGFSKRFKGDHVLAWGGDYQNFMQMDMQAYDVKPYYEWYNFKQSPKNWGIYGLSVIHVTDYLLFNVGVRHDEYETFGGSTNPRLAMIVEPFNGSVFKALYGTAFRAPNGYEVESSDVDNTDANLSIIPEEIETYELIWEQKICKNLAASVSAYYYDYYDIKNDDVDQSEFAPEDWVNDFINCRGVEAEIQGQFSNGIRGRASFSFNDLRERWENPNLSDPLPSQRMIKANVTVPILRSGTRAGVEVQYNSKRRTIAHDIADGHILTNVTLINNSLLSGLEISGSIYNLFNEIHGHPGTWGEVQEIIWQDRRSFRLYLTYSR